MGAYPQMFFEKIDFKLRELLNGILKTVENISQELKTVDDLSMECRTKNQFGETQLKIDLLANEIIKKNLLESELVNAIVSEEEKEVIQTNDPNRPYFVAYDPLDGSSLMKNNASLGSIFAIWGGNRLMGRKGDDLVAAFYAIYGIRLTIVMAVRHLGVVEFVLKEGEKSSFKHLDDLLPESGNFSFGNLRACQSNENLFRLLKHYVEEKKTLRYTGCLVTDFHKIISDQQGVFIYVSGKNQACKLRLTFECAPLAFIMRELKGVATDDLGKPILDIAITNAYQTTSFVFGSRNEVKRVLQYLGARGVNSG